MVADLTGGFNGLDQGEIDRIKDYLEVKTYEAGAEIVHIGAVAEDMYFVLEGEGRINRNGLELGSVHKGDHFGELGLISGRPRAATIVAISPLTVARLERTNFNRLVEHEPHMAARLMLSLINTLGRQLVERTESLDMLLRQRS
ncbi:MAG: cyclic nucleotide-binding domain-containing protein, partial [Turneriella sp.]